MSDQKVTPWFNEFHEGIVPTRIGVYEINSGCDSRTFANWDGVRWGGFVPSIDSAALPHNANYPDAYQKKVWRGLAEKP